MSIAASSLADAPVADWKKPDRKKLSAKRIYTPVREIVLVPEAR
jgi:hypothetical protein